MTLRAKAAELMALWHLQSLPAGSFSWSTPLQSCEHGLYFVIQVTTVLLVLLSSISTFAFWICEICGSVG